jgi:hypothetical protein
MKRLSLLILTLLLACGCRSGRIEQRIADRLREVCKTGEACTININDVIDFQWDKMYVFKYNATPDQVNQALGVGLPEQSELTRKIVFMKGRRIVHREEYPVDIEGLLDGPVVFDISDTEVYKSYWTDHAVFRVEKKEFEDQVCYALTQIN